MLTQTTGRVSDYLNAVERLAPVIAEHRASFDSERRLPDPVFNALADAGLFRLWLPAALGGPELSPGDFMTVVEAVAALDGSVGWLVGNGGGMSRIGGYLPGPVARQFFSDSRAFVTSATGAIGRRREWKVVIASPAAGRSAVVLITHHISWVSRAQKAPTAKTSRRCVVILSDAMWPSRIVACVGAACHGKLRL